MFKNLINTKDNFRNNKNIKRTIKGETMRYLLTVAITLIAVFGLQACGSDIAKHENSDSKMTSTIDFSVKDVVSEAPVDSAMVTWNNNGTPEVLYTDSTGQVVITDLPRGSYTVTITKVGFATVEKVIDLTSLGDSDIPVLPDFDYIILMHAQGVTITGTVKLRDTDANEAPKAGVLVDLTLSATDNIKEVVFTDTTDTNGEYSFSALPERIAQYTITARRTQSAPYYYGSGALGAVTNIKDGEVISMDPLVLTIEAVNLVADSYAREISQSDTLKVAFSDAINLTKVRMGDIAIMNNTPVQVAADYTFSLGDSVMHIFPAQGNWGPSGTFTLNLDIESVRGKTLNTAYTFSVLNDSISTSITTLTANNGTDTTVDYNTTSVDIIWNQVTNAKGYEIYVKDTEGDNYTKHSTIANGEDTIASVGGLDFGDAKTNSILVVSYTDKKISSFQDAPVITFADSTAPSLTAYTYNLNSANLDNTAGLTKDTVLTYALGGSADIDTTALVTVTLQTSTQVMGVDWNWTMNGASPEIETHVFVLPSLSAAAVVTDTIIVDVLTDISGNPITETIKFPVVVF